MVDITAKSNTLRTAIAQAVVTVGSVETIQLINNNQIPKGNIFEMSKAAGLFGVKKTSEIIPDCHPLPIEYTGITFEVQDKSILIKVKVKTIYKTGVEVEAMHGASVVALTMYDMLKPVDKNVEIGQIKLLLKTGGKSDFQDVIDMKLNASVIICSDSVFNGSKEDKVSEIVTEKLTNHGIDVMHRNVLPDDKNSIQTEVQSRINANDNLIITVGGTGLTKRDTTPEAITPLFDKQIQGIEETIRNYGQERTPFAMLSRSVVGLSGKTLIIALPGSSRGVKESLDVLFPHILHVFRVIEF